MIEVVDMRIIRAFETAEEQLEAFLENNRNLDKENLLKKGYVVEIKDNIEGCFILEKMENQVYWLKQLYITKPKAAHLPVLLEAILTLAKRQQAKSVRVQSHQPVVDLLLEALQFHPQKEGISVDNHSANKGNWWTYSVS